MANLLDISNIIRKYIDVKSSVKAQYTVATTEARKIVFENGDFSLFSTQFNNEVEISVIKDKKNGKVSINKFDEDSIKDAVENAFTSAESGNEDENYDIAPSNENAEFIIGTLEPDIDKFMLRAREFADDISSEFPNILVMQLSFSYVREHSLYCNTNGSMDETKKGYYMISAEYAGNDGENTTGISGCYVTTASLDTPFIELGSMRHNLKSAEDALNQVNVSDKFDGEVIFTPNCFATMLYFAVNSFIGDSVLLDGTSIWKDKLNQKVAVDDFTLELKPWDERIIDHQVHTDDGFRTKNCTLIKNGVLTSFAASLYTANKCGIKPIMCDEMDFVVEAGDVLLDNMIKGIKKGLIVGAISCGYPSANGEISGVAKNSFYIEDGEIKGSVSEKMVSFKLQDMFMNIEEISKELPLDGGVVMPYVKVKDIVIS